MAKEADKHRVYDVKLPERPARNDAAWGKPVVECPGAQADYGPSAPHGDPKKE